MIRPNCTISIELDRHTRRYQPGERITGKVRVRADGDVKCDGLSLVRQWRTHGKGNRASGPESSIQLFTGQWRAGTYTYDFDLPCPDQPPTYHGRILNVEWYLDVRADVPWAIDAKASTDIFVELPAGTQPSVDSPGMQGKTGGQAMIGMLFMIPFALVGVGMLGFGVADDDLGLIAFGGVWLGILALMFMLVLKRVLARRAFSAIETHIARDGSGELLIRHRHDTAKLVQELSFKLVVEEVVVRGSGTDKTTYRETVHSDLRKIHVGRTGAHECELRLPMPSPQHVGWSFVASDNKLEWYVLLVCDIDNWPDLRETIALRVQPIPLPPDGQLASG